MKKNKNDLSRFEGPSDWERARQRRNFNRLRMVCIAVIVVGGAAVATFYWCVVGQLS